jgi:hypothetical protein
MKNDDEYRRWNLAMMFLSSGIFIALLLLAAGLD